WLEKTLRVNAAAFYSRYRDIQLTLTGAGPGGIPIVVTGNAGRARIYGTELELAASITHRLLVTANAGYLVTAYTELAPGAAVPPNARFPVAPRWTATTALEYTATLGGSTLVSRAEYTYTSRYNYLFDNPPLSWQPGFSIVNVRVELEPH